MMFQKKTVASAIAGLTKAVTDLEAVILETGARTDKRMAKITDLEADNMSDAVESKRAKAIVAKLNAILDPVLED